MTAETAADRARPDPLELLARDDKWFVSGARALVYAPPFPLHAERPGFWDAAHYLHFPIDPIFTYALIDDRGRELPLRFASRRWRPDRTEARFTAPGVELTETRVMLEDDTLVARVHLRDTSGRARDVHLVAWTAQPTADSATPSNGEAGTATAHLRADRVDGYARRGTTLAAARTVTGSRQQTLNLAVALAVTDADSFAAQLSEPTANHPHYRLTPFYEKLGADGLPNTERLTGLNAAGLLYLGVHRRVHLDANGETQLNVAASVATSLERAVDAAERGAANAAAVNDAERGWRAYYDRIPEFRCDDPYLERYWYYRWYGLRLNTIRADEGHYRHPVVCEGIGYFRLPISYSMQVHLKETRWMRDAELADGILQTAIDNQTENGTFPAHLYREWRSPHEIYHADWGGAVDALNNVHPDRDRLERAYDPLERYAAYFRRDRDRDDTGLYDIINQWETGQEYMSRYFAADEDADLWQDMKARLKGVDASVYLYRLHRTLERAAHQLGRDDDAPRHRANAEHTAAALLERAWDADREAFFDLGPDGQRAGTLHGTSFYPYLTDLTGEAHLNGLHAHLLNPEEFLTEHPFPSSARTDPYYSAEPEWKGKRHNCPWNGRVWPMTNSHLADVLGRQSELEPALRDTTADFVRRFVHMMFEDGDVERPNCFEHYNPDTGRPSAYRGIDDYMHSYVADLLVRYVAGIHADGDRVRIDPFPFHANFSLRGARVRGHDIDVSYDRDTGYRVTVDGRDVARGDAPHPVQLEF